MRYRKHTPVLLALSILLALATVPPRPPVSPLDGPATGQDMAPGWTLHWTPPAVALFSGAATFDYPLPLPAGPAWAPALSLNYNSRRVDGRLGWQDSEWVGIGWSLDWMDIVRD